ncbi:MAG: HAD hydrolase family protein [Terrimicrobiaceae bacterium]|nr:HAD hydrolase family protein [Terrimicrobiaceae bacterium]
MNGPRLWSTDFDGTLISFGGSGRCPGILAEMLISHRSAGGLWAVNTGRGLDHMLDGLERFGPPAPPDFLLTNEREVFRRTRRGAWEPHGEWNAVCARRHREFFGEFAGLFEEIEAFAASTSGLDFLREPCGQPAGLVAESEEVMDAAATRLREWARDVPEFSWQRNTVYLRFCHADYDKGSALAELCRLEGLEPRDVLAVGDQHNDLPMLHPSRAAFLACPSNAIPEVKAAVRSHGGYVARQAWGEGTAEAAAFFQMASSAASMSEQKSEAVGAASSAS